MHADFACSDGHSKQSMRWELRGGTKTNSKEPRPMIESQLCPDRVCPTASRSLVGRCAWGRWAQVGGPIRAARGLVTSGSSARNCPGVSVACCAWKRRVPDPPGTMHLVRFELARCMVAEHAIVTPYGRHRTSEQVVKGGPALGQAQVGRCRPGATTMAGDRARLRGVAQVEGLIIARVIRMAPTPVDLVPRGRRMIAEQSPSAEQKWTLPRMAARTHRNETHKNSRPRSHSTTPMDPSRYPS